MPVCQRSSTYHSRFCALRHWKVAMTFFLFCLLQVILRWRELGKPPQGEQQSVIFYVAVVAVIATLGQLVIEVKSFRERVVLVLVMVSFVFILVKGLWPARIEAVALISEEALLLLWVVASTVSLSMVVTALRVRGRLGKTQAGSE